MAEGGDIVWVDAPAKRRHAGARSGLALWVVAVSAVGALGILALVLTAPGDRGSVLEGVPRELTGRWGTTDERYADRELVVQADRVEIDVGPEEGGRLRYPLVAVRGWEDGADRGYRLRYQTPDGVQLLDVTVLADGTLRLANPSDVVWRRIP